MAYTTLKRIFGETRLELKLLFLFGAGLLVIIGTAFWWYGREMTTLVAEQNRDSAQLVLQEHVLTTHLGAYKIKLTRPGYIEPTPEEVNEERQFVEWNKRTFSKHPGRVELIWSHDHPGAGAPRDDELAICDAFLKGAPPTAKSDEPRKTEYRELTDEREYRYFEPIRAKASCLTMCHAPPPGGSGIDATGSPGVSLAGPAASSGKPPLEEGDVMAIAKVTISVGETRDKVNRNSAILWTYAIVTVFVGMITLYAIVRYVIVKPLRHLRDVSDSVTRGNIA
jgi:hypothetical protein